MNDLHRIFSDCLKYSEAQWPEVLLSACGPDHALRAEVEKLLEADRLNQQSGFLEIDCSTEQDVWGQRLRPGQTIGGYRLLEVLGTGGLGIVYKAKKLDRLSPADPNEFVAVKVLQSWHLDPSSLARFRADGFVLQGLSHANIANWIDTGTDAGIPYFVMEYIDGRPLHARLKDENGKLNANSVPLRKRVEWIVEICEGLTAAHGRLILHRHLKPGNVLINQLEHAIITDFGLAKYIEPQADDQLSLTSYGRALGTMRYMAPEQFIPNSNLGLPTDVYGSGGLLYFVLTGPPPHELPSVLPNGALLNRSQPIALRTIDPDVPKDLETICLKCLSSEPARRYQSVELVREDLNRYLEGLPIYARKVGLGEQFIYWCRRRPRRASFLAFTLAGALVSAITIVSLWWQANTHWASANQNLQIAEKRNDDLIALIGNLTELLQETETDPATAVMQHKILRIIAVGYDQIAAASTTPVDSAILHNAGVAWFKLGRIENQLGDSIAKTAAYRRAETIFQELVEREPNEIQHRFDLFHSLCAQRDAKRSLAMIESIVADDDYQDPHFLNAYCQALRDQAMVDIGQRDFESAEKLSTLGKKISLELVERDPQEPLHHRKLGQLNEVLMYLHVGKNRIDKAFPYLIESIDNVDQAYQLTPRDDGICSELHRTLLIAAAWCLVEEKIDTAQQFLARADNISEYYLGVFPYHSDAWQNRMQYHQVATILDYYHRDRHSFLNSRANYEEILNRRLELDPKCWRANSELAWLISDPTLTADPDLERGWSLIQKAMQNPSAHPLFDVAGLIAFRRGDFQTARQHFDNHLDYEQQFSIKPIPDKIDPFRNFLIPSIESDELFNRLESEIPR